MDIARAEAFCRSYGEAMAAGGAVALAAHYAEPYVSFTLGHVAQFATRRDAIAAVQNHLDRFERNGLGLDVRLDGHVVTPVSNGSALCRLRWSLHPPGDREGWAWDNVYGLRQTATGQAFEFNISDNEIGELLTRYPDFMAS